MPPIKWLLQRPQSIAAATLALSLLCAGITHAQDSAIDRYQQNSGQRFQGNTNIQRDRRLEDYQFQQRMRAQEQQDAMREAIRQARIQQTIQELQRAQNTQQPAPENQTSDPVAASQSHDSAYATGQAFGDLVGGLMVLQFICIWASLVVVAIFQYIAMDALPKTVRECSSLVIWGGIICPLAQLFCFVWVPGSFLAYFGAEDAQAKSAKTFGVVSLVLMILSAIPCLGQLAFLGYAVCFVIYLIKIHALGNRARAGAPASPTPLPYSGSSPPPYFSKPSSPPMPSQPDDLPPPLPTSRRRQ